MESGAARSSRSLIVSPSSIFFVNSTCQFPFFPVWIALLKYSNLMFLAFYSCFSVWIIFVFSLLCFHIDILALDVFDLFLFHFLLYHLTNTTSSTVILQ